VNAPASKEALTVANVREVMTPNPVTLPSDASLHDAARRMRDDGIGDVLVVEGGEVRGIVTDRDITIRAVAEGRDPSGTTLADVCSSELVTAAPEDNADDAAQRMREAGVRRVPVIDNGQPIGVVSIGDLAIEKDPGSALGDISSQPPNQ
jgi:CBS domain-containing protein